MTDEVTYKADLLEDLPSGWSLWGTSTVAPNENGAPHAALRTQRDGEDFTVYWHIHGPFDAITRVQQYTVGNREQLPLSAHLADVLLVDLD